LKILLVGRRPNPLIHSRAAAKKLRKDDVLQNRTRKIPMTVMVTPEEKSHIQKMITTGQFGSFGAYARKMLMNGYIVNVDLSKYHELAKEVNKVGVNVNQIAKLANERGDIYAEDISRTRELVNEIWLLLRSSLSALQSKTQ
jgi:hypothetical protein